MNWTKKEVPSLELCKRLKELGFPQEGEGWCWYTNKEILRWKVVYNKGFYPIEELYGEYIKAPTCREMAFWIAKGVKNLAKEDNDKIGYLIAGKELYWEVSPDDFAKDLIWLAKNGYVKFKEG